MARDSNGRLHFVFARYRPDESQHYDIADFDAFNGGKNIEEMRRLAHLLLSCCDEPVIGPPRMKPDSYSSR